MTVQKAKPEELRARVAALDGERAAVAAHAWIFFQEPVSAAAARRLHDRKREVLIVLIHVDCHVPVLARMAAKRRTGYGALGYEIRTNVGEDEMHKPPELPLY